MKKFVGELFRAPDGIRGDEISLLAFALGVLGAMVLAEFALLEGYSVVILKEPLPSADFANGAATLFGALTGGLSAVAAAMGLKAKLGG
jgi:hypothetical protein